MAGRRPESDRMKRSRRRAECARAAPDEADALGRSSDVLLILNVARNSSSAKKNARTDGEVVTIRFDSDALKRVNSEIDRRPKCPDTGWLGFR
jgi:hypothetical protein